jgi:hypothetical protein
MRPARDSAVQGGIMSLFDAVLGAWAGFLVAFCTGWARYWRSRRAADGIDEELYLDGLDDRSIEEAR